MKMIVLVGLPGSGKSTYREKSGLKYVNQDELGSRDKCAEEATKLFNSGFDVIIDRTNIDRRQRRNWLKLAKYLKVQEVECVYFKADPEKCLERIKKRVNHPTIPQQTDILKLKSIVNKFRKALEVPDVQEGFTNVTVIDVDASTSTNN